MKKAATVANINRVSRAALGILCGVVLAGSSLQAGFPSELDHKLAPALKHEVEFLTSHPEYDYPIQIIVRMERQFFLQSHRRSGRRNEDTSNGLSLVRSYARRLSARQIGWLVRSSLVEYVTLDAPVRPTGKHGGEQQSSGSGGSGSGEEEDSGPLHLLRSTIGVDQVQATGNTVTVAVFDSGIDPHSDLDREGRVKASVDFTFGKEHRQRRDRRWRGTDEYGHGTHVAGIIGGQGDELRGVAQDVQFVDLKVIGPEGWGLTSDLIRAMGWAIENKDKHDIRVANLSLGHAPLESYQQDPLCQAAEAMVEAGIVTVVSAGNLGRTDEHAKIWGSISSPGLDPLVITVYPVNTHGTLTHTDDTATSYGSRGPTLDGLFKPDLAAPGNRIVSLLATESTVERIHPELVTNAE